MAKKREPKDDGPRCGSCYYLRKQDGAVGQCYGMPPQLDTSNEPPTILRPVLEVSEFPCIFWRARQ